MRIKSVVLPKYQAVLAWLIWIDSGVGAERGVSAPVELQMAAKANHLLELNVDNDNKVINTNEETKKANTFCFIGFALTC